MKISLIWPKSTFLTNPMVYPPLGLWYIWTILKQAGCEVVYIDTSEDLYGSIPESDYYFVSGTSPQLMEIRKILSWLQNNRRGKTVLGGSHALTHSIDHLENLGFDLVYKGEMNTKEDIDLIFNASPTKKLIDNPFSQDLENLCLPTRKVAFRYKAFLEDRSGTSHPTTTLFTSRGCPEKCAFCESGAGRMWGKGVRWNPLEIVTEELEECYELGFTGIMFYDDILPLNKPRMLKLLEVLDYYHNKDGAIWRCFLRTDILEKQGGHEYLEKMRNAGLVEVLVGVESGSDQIKKNIQKGTSIRQDTKTLEWCKKLGIKFKASFVLGLPGETIESMEATRKWILANRPDRVDVNTYIPFPGTPISSDMALKSGNYDIYIDSSHTDEKEGYQSLPETFWYKGPRDKSNCLVGTSSLAPQEIANFRNKLIQEIIEVGIPY